jgi:hypothetical protein
MDEVIYIDVDEPDEPDQVEVVLLETPQEAGTIIATNPLEINQLLAIFHPARSLAFITELLTTKTVAEAYEELLNLPKDPQDAGSIIASNI